MVLYLYFVLKSVSLEVFYKAAVIALCNELCKYDVEIFHDVNMT